MPKTTPKAAAARPATSRRHDLVLPPCPGGLRLDQALSQALPQYSRSRLAFEHPITGKAIEVTSPLPADFKRLLAVLREG